MENMNIPQDMKDALKKYKHAANEIFEAFKKSLQSRKEPKIIYHYTNDVGLRGILQTGQLWSTNIFNLNDPSELSHGCSLAANILNKMAEKHLPETQLFAKLFSHFVQDGLRSTADYFVCAFSTDDDDLGQWRAYADNGRGYALGFDADILANGFAKKDGNQIPNNSTFHITYDDVGLEKLHRQIIESMFDLISLPRGRKLDETSVNAFTMELSVLLSINVLQAALYFKHKAYENEKEFRFLQLYGTDAPSLEVKQRFRTNELVRYKEFDWKHLQAGVLKQIVIGPGADRKKATQFVTDCLTAFEIGNVEIQHSNIPYRAI